MAATNWYEANQKYTSAALAVVRCALGRHTAPSEEIAETGDSMQEELQAAAADLPAPSALERLCATFGLGPFERDLLLLCAGIELDSRFAALCASAQGDPARAYPTFSLALAALDKPLWSALAPNAPLRYWRLIQVENGSALTTSPLRIDERVLHYLAGVQHLDERLVGLVEPLRVSDDLVPSHQALAERLARAWSLEGPLPVIQLCGVQAAAKHYIAASACRALGLNLYSISADVIPTSPGEIESLARLWAREAALSTSALFLDWHESDAADRSREAAITRWIESLNSPLIVASRERRRIQQRPVVVLDVENPTAPEQRALWRAALGAAADPLNGRIDALVAQYDLSAPAIYSASVEALRGTSDDLARALWESCRSQSRPRLDDLAQRLMPVARWDDLVLPEPQRGLLHEIAASVRQRATVYETWGFASTSARGLGISALFAGVSGTGKTMAAEVLANELSLDLYRIDLSQVVSKYIGETEKNLRRVFDAAEEGGAILLFDEADALFGKRSEVKDSHDRYANIETSYLLQRMEAYRGLAILTTNMKNALDAAFLRRIRFVVQFSFPDVPQRAEIWRRIFPPGVPIEALDFEKLARLNVAGGSIRNIALNAAFLAADAHQPVKMSNLLRAARTEYAKMEKLLSEAEIGGWA